MKKLGWFMHEKHTASYVECGDAVEVLWDFSYYREEGNNCRHVLEVV